MDGNELGQVYSFQLKLKYEDPEDERVVGATMDFVVDFGIYIHIPLQKKFSRTCAACCDRVHG